MGVWTNWTLAHWRKGARDLLIDQKLKEKKKAIPWVKKNSKEKKEYYIQSIFSSPLFLRNPTSNPFFHMLEVRTI